MAAVDVRLLYQSIFQNQELSTESYEGDEDRFC